MILGDGHLSIRKSLNCSRAIKPGRRHKASHWAADDILEQMPSFGYPGGSFVPREPKEFAFPGCHEPRPQLVRSTAVPGLVTMIEAVQENLETLMSPRTQSGGECGPRHDGCASPMVRDHQHRDAVTDIRAQQVHELIDLGFETR